mmetsp:Transcript_8690/g.35558  ORF Transcript_8690/g.35558 Transcript_8690/m.35558 type:complete len:453 (-) Transcript_8690:1860-3218(-)
MRVLAYRKGNIESYVRHPVFAASVSLSFVCEVSLVSCALGIWLVSCNPLRDDPAFSQLLPDPDPVVPETLQRLLLGGLRVRVRVHAGNYLREDALHREPGLDAGLSSRVQVSSKRGLLHADPLPLVRHRARGSGPAGVEPGEVQRATSLSQSLEHVVANGGDLEGLATLLCNCDCFQRLARAEALVGNLPSGRRTLASGLVRCKLPTGRIHHAEIHPASPGPSSGAGGGGGGDGALQTELRLALRDERREALDPLNSQSRAAEAINRDGHRVCDVLGQKRGHDCTGRHAQLRRGVVPPREHPSKHLAVRLGPLSLARLFVVPQHAHPSQLRIERGSGASVQLRLRHGAHVHAGIHQLLDFLVRNLRSLAHSPGNGLGDREDNLRQFRLRFGLSCAAQRAHNPLRDGLAVWRQGECLIRGVTCTRSALGHEALGRKLLRHVLRRFLTPGLFRQ